MKSESRIMIRGARQHNLKNIDLDLPRNRLIVVTGLSGSGKSTLAFDTLYAEGQRRYVESLSAYARQFLERLEKPDVDLIDGLSPAIAIEQKTAGHNPRSTVSTVTEIYDYLRLLFARTGVPHCRRCGRPVTARTLDQIMDQILALPEKSRIMIIAPVSPSSPEEGPDGLIRRLQKEGFSRIRADGEILEIETLKKPSVRRNRTVEVVVDRLIIKPGVENRLADSLELALSRSEGLVEVDVIGGESIRFSEKPECLTCGIRYPEFTPAHFSFNSPSGACSRCDGLGTVTEFDPELIVPNPELSLRDGAVAPWAKRNPLFLNPILEDLVRPFHADIYTPYKNLPETFRELLLHGSKGADLIFHEERNGKYRTVRKPFEGLIPNLQRRYSDPDASASVREEIRQYINFQPCPECRGARLNPDVLTVKIDGNSIADISALTIHNALDYFHALGKKLTGKWALIADRLLKEIITRLTFIESVGLGYLTLARSAATLSGGESQRIRLATQIGSRLTGVLYVLDEPSIGLHQRDNRRLLDSLLQMRDTGNTVLVVEHDDETILAADHIVDMGPGAGTGGGKVIFSGTPEQLMADEKSLTGQYLSGKKRIETPPSRRPGNGEFLRIRNATANNLKGIDAVFPLGSFICVTGVSGSGKSTLILETLYRAVTRHLYRTRTQAGACDGIDGLEQVDKVIHIDQSPIGRTPRSNPATYTGLFTHIREILSRTPEARMRGYKPGRFSFNVKGGRCEACKGDGIIKIEMHFLPDIYVPCDVCLGNRYNRETLEIRYKGKRITDILEMTVNQGLDFFRNVPAIRTRLDTLADVGLGYIRIGQPATTLSGGEAQRIKLSKELSKRATGKTVYILDEPTTGLHADDIRRLLYVLNQLTDMGNTVIVIEHHLDVIKSADYIIDMGPEGGDAGGEIVAAGTPEEIAEAEGSFTGEYLRKILKH